MATWKLRGRSKLLALVLVVLLVLGCGAGYWFYWRKRGTSAGTKATTAMGVCQGGSVNLLGGAAAYIDTKNHAELGAIVKNIQAVKNYDKDTDCMYAVTKYYVGISDAGNARTSFTNLSRAFNASKKTSPFFKVSAGTITDLQKQVEFLELLNKTYDKKRLGQ